MNLRSELHHAEQLLMKWPRAIRLQLQVQALRRQLAALEASKARALRGQIRRSLMSADLNTLSRLARDLEAS